MTDAQSIINELNALAPRLGALKAQEKAIADERKAVEAQVREKLDKLQGFAPDTSTEDMRGMYSLVTRKDLDVDSGTDDLNVIALVEWAIKNVRMDIPSLFAVKKPGWKKLIESYGQNGSSKCYPRNTHYPEPMAQLDQIHRFEIVEKPAVTIHWSKLPTEPQPEPPKFKAAPKIESDPKTESTATADLLSDDDDGETPSAGGDYIIVKYAMGEIITHGNKRLLVKSYSLAQKEYTVEITEEGKEMKVYQMSDIDIDNFKAHGSISFQATLPF